MKSKISVFLIVGFVVSLCALTTLAQTEEQKEQLYSVDDYAVKPSMVDEFEAGIKEWVALCTQYKYPYSWIAYSLNDFHYIFSYPLENYAALDGWDKASDELREKVGKEQWQALSKRVFNTFEYFNSSMIYLIPELSYTHENPRLKPEDKRFIFWDFYYIQPGKQKEFEELNKQWVALYKNNNIPDEYDFYVGDIGTEMPVYFYAEGGKSNVDFWTQHRKSWELFGKEGDDLWERTEILMRKREMKTGWYRPDLSYIPKEK